MGSTMKENFPEVESVFEDAFAQAQKTGRAFEMLENEVSTSRHGFLEEVYVTGSIIPLREINGEIMGYYLAIYDASANKIRERRRALLSKLEVPSGFLDESFASYVIPVLEQSPRDIPMALLYQLDEEATSGQRSLILRGSIGVPKSHILAKEVLDYNQDEAIVTLLQQAQDKVIAVSYQSLFEGIEWRGFGESSTQIFILPLNAAGKLLGYLVVGSNPRQKMDDGHELFMRDMASRVAAVASAFYNADEVRRHAQLLEKELADSERQIRYMAQHASVGMHHVAIDGTMLWANEHYYRMTDHPRQENKQYKHSFIDVFIEEDQSKAKAAWKLLLQGQPNVSVELRLNKLYTPPSGDAEPACILALSFPYLEDGKVKSIMTCITDVSSLKWAESSEARNAADAREAKRQQEEFIDLVSHELRNPLSAIFQLADTIIASFPENHAVGTPEDDPMCQAVRNNIEAATTILMCATHQKRIVDDVLTLSKLDYQMLDIVPRPKKLNQLLEHSTSMFEADFVALGIEVRTVPDPSIAKHKVDWIMCDESRVAQIFINILTNAIKFTKTEDTRKITIRYGATLSSPRAAFSPRTSWAPGVQEEAHDLTLNPEWGEDEQMFITVTVTDTGVGMTKDQIKKLFSRFQQASEKTSIKYGGSGLGLFISQKLTEKLGGEIGVLSQPGKGSTFSFYVKVRRTEFEPEILAENANVLQSPKLLSMSSRTSSNPVKIGAPETDLNRIHVLLVEDNLVNQKVLSRQLTNEGCIVSVANHGAEALKFLETTNAWHDSDSLTSSITSLNNNEKNKENAQAGRNGNGTVKERLHIDIILMDWEMPIMDGLTASREIRRLQAEGKVTRYLEIVATTANAREEQVKIALESGIVSLPFP
jgi:signal transduction histidine kinase